MSWSLLWSKNYRNFGTTPELMQFCILSSFLLYAYGLLSVLQLIAQQMLARIEVSFIRLLATTQKNTGIAYATSLYEGRGLVLQIPERAQEADSIISLSTGVLCNSEIEIYITLHRFCTPPFRKIMSLYPGESHAILPRAHTACSTMPICSDKSKSTNIFTPPFSMIELVCWEFPAATLVKHHTDYSCS